MPILYWRDLFLIYTLRVVWDYALEANSKQLTTNALCVQMAFSLLRTTRTNAKNAPKTQSALRVIIYCLTQATGERTPPQSTSLSATIRTLALEEICRLVQRATRVNFATLAGNSGTLGIQGSRLMNVLSVCHIQPIHGASLEFVYWSYCTLLF